MNRLICAALTGTFCFTPLLALAADDLAKPDAEKPVVKIELKDDNKEKAELKTLVAKPATQPAGIEVTADVRKVLNDVRDAYRNLKSLELSGTVSAKFDVAGQKQDDLDTFTATYQVPNLFRHEMKDDMLVGSTGEKVYAFQAGQNLYVQKDAPKERSAIKDLPAPLNKLIPMQNPGLALAIAPDAGEQLINDATAASKQADLLIEGKPFTSLLVSTPAGDWTYLIDPQTHLLFQAVLDQKAYLTKVGQTDVKQAKVAFGYTKVTPGIATKEAQFAWVPPAAARDMSTLANANAGEEDPAAKLEGNAAPDFKLLDLAGKEVKLSALKGSVVVVDFWATWCGPCVQSLPKLNELYDDKKAAGLKVIAISVDEDKAKVPPFVENKKLHFTVVTDSEQEKAAEKFLVRGIPQTVVVGKNGKVRKVFVGFGPGSEEKLRAEVEAAMKE